MEMWLRDPNQVGPDSVLGLTLAVSKKKFLLRRVIVAWVSSRLFQEGFLAKGGLGMTT